MPDELLKDMLKQIIEIDISSFEDDHIVKISFMGPTKTPYEDTDFELKLEVP